MLMTVTNLQGTDMNDLDTYLAGVQGTPSSLAATGGARKDALPFPFDRNGKIAAGASKTLPVRSADFQRQNTPFVPLAPATEWQQLIQAGKISVIFAQESAQVLLFTGVDANGGVKFTAKVPNVRIRFTNGAGNFSVSVSGLDITVALNVGTTVASDIVTGIVGSGPASALVSAAATGNGGGVASVNTTYRQVPYGEGMVLDKLIAGL